MIYEGSSAEYFSMKDSLSCKETALRTFCDTIQYTVQSSFSFFFLPRNESQHEIVDDYQTALCNMDPTKIILENVGRNFHGNYSCQVGNYPCQVGNYLCQVGTIRVR